MRVRYLPGFAFVLAACFSSAAAQYWESTTSAAPWTVRSSGTAIGFNNRLFVFNGYKEVSMM
ncbi:MAG: hypothetical protein J7K88_07225 [Candidatus Fermentibacteraceae bacterium]|nr:hypothetical protein [Candidatus Fermentibacteraceae bacterium]